MSYDSYSSYPQPSDGFQPSEPSAPTPAPRKKRRWMRVVALCLVCALIGGGAGLGSAALYFHQAGGTGTTTTLYESNRQPTAVNISHTSTGEKMSLDEIYASWVNSTVGISTEIVTTNYFGQQVSAAAGSGFVVSEDGYIVTNYHVIDGASTIKVTFYDGTVYDATLVGGEETNDVAVLKIDATGLTPVIIGDSDTLNVGEIVTAIGNPLGELTFSQTAGIVSALNRMITMSDGTKMNMIQTDCTINSGNSGGPLFNEYGEVVGITSAKYSNNGSSSEATIEGIGFAIPINDVIDIVKDIIEHGYVTGRPYMGVSVVSVSESDAQRYNLVVGAYVNTVEAGGPADMAGLKQGDVIVAMDDTEITTSNDLIYAKNTHKAGDTATLKIYRAGQEMNLTITFGEETPQEETATVQPTSQPQQGQDYGSSYWPFGGFGW